MALHVNTFNGGMDKDTSKQKYANTKYIDSKNTRPVTDEGLSTGALENIKGNLEVSKFPAIIGMFTLDINNVANLETGSATTPPFIVLTNSPLTTINNPGITYTSANDLTEQIYNIIITANETLPPALQYRVGIIRNLNRIVIYNQETSILSIYFDTGFGAGSLLISLTAYDTNSGFIELGSEAIRDDIIIFTKNTIGESGFGQIWKMSYDTPRPENTAGYLIKLIYNGALNFSLEHPIEAKTAYENINTQGVYFTDNFNPLRSCNIASENVFAFRPQDFLLSPESQLSPAYVNRENQSEGNLLSGIWYTTYSISKQGGGVSPNAPFSAGVGVFNDDVSTGIGGTNTEYHLINWTETIVPTKKALDFTIFNLPRGFNEITIYAIHEPEPGNYQVFLYKTETLSDAFDYNFTISDISDKIEVPFTSLVNTDIDFERVKTLTVKDNTLLVGNVKQSAFNIDFDARAYRFKTNSSDTYVDVNTSLPDFGIDKELDISNPMNRDSTIDPNSTYYLYQENTALLGGTGPNISYEFTTEDIVLDDSTAAEPLDESSRFLNKRAPFVNQPAVDNIIRTVNNNSIDIGPGFKSFKNTKIDAYKRGYMRDEVYRFGIVFYSTTGKPSEVKWIDDIRFPSAGDFAFNADGFQESGLGQFTSTNIVGNSNGASVPNAGANGTRGYTMGIKFTVDVSNISDKISGYSIVRAPRREKDRTIIAEGVMHRTRKLPSIPSPIPSTINIDDIDFASFKGNNIRDSLYIQDEILNEASNTQGAASKGDANWQFGTLDCPDLKFITGAKLNGYEDNNSNEEILYRLKPVALYSHLSEDNSLSTGAIIEDGSDASEREDYYSKSAVLLNNVNFHDRYIISKNWGALRDIFFTDHAAGNISINGEKFNNAGIVDFVKKNLGTGFNVDQGFTGLGTRTILFGGRNSNIVKYLINYSGGKVNGSSPGAPNTINNDFTYDPYELDGGSNNNDLQKWGYGSTIDRVGNYAIVDIYRDLEFQYGGATNAARKSTEYMTTGHYQPVDNNTTTTEANVWGGDITTALWTEKKFFTYQQFFGAGADPDNYGRKTLGGIRGVIIPLQTVVNTELRTLIHLNNFNSLQVSATDISIHRFNPDETLIPILYHKERNPIDYLAAGNNELISEYDNRVYMSNVKSNGETSNSWSIFDSLKFKDVDGEYGPINKLEVFNDRLMFWQDKAFGILAFNPRSVVNDQYGTELTLGTGSGIVDFKYISNTIGAFHQWGVIKGSNAIYFFDGHHKKFFSFSGQNNPISDLKGMSSWFYNTIVGDILNNDNPILFKGVTGVHDKRFNEIIFTFHSQESGVLDVSQVGGLNENEDIGNIETDGGGFNPGGDTTIGGEGDSGSGEDVSGEGSIGGSGEGGDEPEEGFVPRISASNKEVTSDISTIPEGVVSYTVVYNELFQAFTAFYDHYPRHYITNGRRIFTKNPSNVDDLYVHDEGNRGQFYTQTFPSTIELMVKPNGNHTKVFTNMEFLSQVYDENGNNIVDETLNSVEYSNEYQTTGLITFTPNTNIKRRMRTWRTAIPRSGNARIRNPYMNVKMIYENNNNKRIILHDIINHYKDVPM